LSSPEVADDSPASTATSGSPSSVPTDGHEKKTAPFESFATLISTHTELLKSELSQDESTRPGFIERVNEFIRRGVQTGTILDDNDQRRTAQSLLNYWVTVLYRAEGTTPPDAILAYYSPRADLGFECPYVGLSPFQETDSLRFFGREQLTANIVQRLYEKHFVALVGLSGSGKTSVLNAGVLPALKSGTLVPETKDWTYYPAFTPGCDPLASLASLFTEDVKTEADRLLRKPEYLLDLIKNSSSSDHPAVFVIDQFEEVFTCVKEDQRRDAFINALMSLKDAPLTQRVILAMRSDRINQIIRRPVLNELFRDAEIRMDPLRETSLRDIIEKPAQKIGLKFQPGVVDQIIREIYAEPVPLPLLQFALLELWSNREIDTITWSGLNKLGDFREALAAKAESFYWSLDPNEQSVVRRILLRMVRLSNTWEATSEPVRRDDLDHAGEDPRRVNEVLAKLLAANLVRISNSGRWLNLPGSTTAKDSPPESPEDQFELAHESLARTWPELGSWLRTLRESVATRQRLGLYAANWVILGRSDKGLLDKYQLHEAETWLASDEAKELGYDADLDGLVRKSRETHNHEKLLQKLRWVGLAVLILFGLGLIVTAFVAGQQQRLKQETALRLALQAGAIRTNQLDLALLLNREAYLKDTTTPEAQNSLMRSMNFSPKLRAFLYNEKSNIRQIVFNDDGTRLSLLDSAGKVRSWDVTRQSLIGEVQIPATHRGAGKSQSRDDASLPRLSRNGKYLFYAEAPGQVVIWDLETNQKQSVPTSTKQVAAPFAFTCSSDNTKLAWLTSMTVENNKTPTEVIELTLWNVGDQKALRRLTNNAQKIAFSPDSQALAIASSDQTITLHRAADLGPIGKPLKDAFDPSTSLGIAFSANGNSLVSMNPRGELGVWSITDQRSRFFKRELPASNIKLNEAVCLPSPVRGPVRSFALSGDGNSLVAGYDDGTVTIWNLTSGEKSEYTTRHKGNVTEIVFSADDKKLITAADVEGPILLWEMVDSKYGTPTWQNTRELLGGLAGRIANISFNRDSKLIVGANTTCGDDDGTVILWDLDQNLMSAGGSLSHIGSPQGFSDDGSLLTLNESDEVVLTKLDSGVEVKRFSIKADWIKSEDVGSQVREVLFNKNGKLLAARYQGNSVAVWDTGTGQRNVIMNGGERQGDSIIGMAIDDAGSKLALGWSSGEIVILGLQDGRSNSIKYDPVSSLTLTFNADGSKLASSDDKGILVIWDAVRGTQLARRAAKDQTQSYRLAFTKDGTKLVCLSGDALTLWNPEGVDQEKILTKSLNISNFVLNPVRDSVAANGNDGSIIFWDLNKWAEQFRFAPGDVASFGQGNNLTGLLYVRDGNRLVVRYSNASISTILVDLNLWAKRACSIANRSLTPVELKAHGVFADQEWKFWRTKPESSYVPCPKSQ
jgi:WD40 repeat protein